MSSGKLSNEPIISRITIPEYLRKGATGFENITEISKDNYLIGTIDGYFTLDVSDLKKPEEFQITINEVKVFERDNISDNIDLSKEQLSFNNQKNNFEFFYNVSNFDKISNTNYKYKLEGLNEEWSSLSVKGSVLLENIPFGKYIFKVKAKIGDKESENIASYRFEILRPWYLSYYMIAFYILCGLAVIYISHIKSKHYYKSQRQKLLEKTKKETEIRELENSQKIIKLNNDKLRSDIDSKNKELASSIMNLIKKNEFLNTIKKELKEGNERSIDKVVKIIDKNLNNTDDWKMFQEAFNNTDKKFIKKLKSKHSTLTPNDLRLCAYLRLNLSSKEIAPLLNISTRSVEVKRYRLRKKLDLDHDKNLTNYILGL